MDNMDDAETNAKISDSAYSNSCSNSQSRRSHSSKSRHSGSNSSGSSGYGGKASTSGSSNNLGQPPKKDKESKKKKLIQAEVLATEAVPADEPIRAPEPHPATPAAPTEESDNVVESAMTVTLPDTAIEDMDTSTADITNAKEDAPDCQQPVSTAENIVSSRSPPHSSDGFSCVISMHDGVVMYTSATLTTTLGFPKGIWIGRSFIDFVHPKDHKTFASLITNGLALPKLENGKHERVGQGGLTSGSAMVCRLRRYRSLNSAFGVKEAVITYMPFLLKFLFKNYSDDDVKVVYLVIQATPFFSAFKSPNELVTKQVPFVIRHAADGTLEYIDPESVPYLGYLPQDIQDKNALLLYHPEDLPYLKQIYESVVKEGSVNGAKSYRIQAQNADYVRVETEWTSVINPWSMKLEFVIAKHHVVEGPTNPDVFQSPGKEQTCRITVEENNKEQTFMESFIKIMNEVRTKPAELAKQQMGKRCQDLLSFMETLVEDAPKQEDELRLEIQEIQERDNSNYERDSVMLGGISPHHDSDSKFSIETPLSYNQLNYNENLQRYFDSQLPVCYENVLPVELPNDPAIKSIKVSSCISPTAHNSGENEFSSNSSALAVYVSSPGPACIDYQYVKLTESMIQKHNSEMEKELVKLHRELRSSKGEREKASNETKKKKKEHLARCNATFQPTAAGDTSTVRNTRQQGVKRASKQQYNDSHAQKHHCPSPREHRRRLLPTSVTPPSNPSVTVTTTVAASPWPPTQNVSSFNMFAMPPQMPMVTHLPPIPVPPGGVGLPTTVATGSTGIGPMPGTSSMTPIPCTSTSIPGAAPVSVPGTSAMSALPAAYGVPAIPGASGLSAMPVMSGMTGAAPVSVPGTSAISALPAAYGVPALTGTSGMSTMSVMPEMTGMYPVYYSPSSTTPSISNQVSSSPSSSGYQPFQAHLPYMVHGHPISMMYGQPFMYSPINPQMIPVQHNLLTQQTMQFTNSHHALGLTTSSYEQACKSLLPMPPRKFARSLKQKKRDEAKTKTETNSNQSNGDSSTDLKRTTDIVTASTSNSQCEKSKTRNSDENTDRTDGGSSYSSFYSSFFKTDSGSAEDSGEQKNKNTETKNRFWTKNMQGDDAMSFQSSYEATELKRNDRKLARRKMDAPWNEQVNMTSELIYKYQVLTKPMETILEADKQRMKSMEQPSLVNEQLAQLYLDLQLQGVAARLTLEEGITSSSSSGEETSPTTNAKRKRQFSKLVIIHEENAPLPAPESGPLIPEEMAEEDTAPSSMTS